MSNVVKLLIKFIKIIFFCIICTINDMSTIREINEEEGLKSVVKGQCKGVVGSSDESQ